MGCRDFSQPIFSQPDFSQLFRILMYFQPCKSWQSPVRVRGRVRYIFGFSSAEKNRKFALKIGRVAKSRVANSRVANSRVAKSRVAKSRVAKSRTKVAKSRVAKSPVAKSQLRKVVEP